MKEQRCQDPSASRWIRSLIALGALILMPNAWSQVGLKVQLVPEVTAITPGHPFYVGLFLQHDPGYHTYWKFPGIVGVATTVEWRLPPGFESGPLEYPEPEETMMFQIKAQGYERDVLLQTRITPPENLPVGTKVTLTGKASWMCCGRTCHPDTLDLNLELPVATETSFDSRWRPVFEKERAAYAKPSIAWAATAEETETIVTLKLSPQSTEARRFVAEPVDDIHFFTEDGWINSDEPQAAKLGADGSLLLTLRRADVFLGKERPRKLLGVLQRNGGWLANGNLRSMTVQPVLIQ